MSPKVAGSIALLASVLAGASTHAECPLSSGRWGYGPTGAVAVAGTHAYYGSGAVLMIADVGSPAAATVVGHVLLPDSIRGIAVSGTHAYVGTNHAGLRVVDVSNPAAPVEVGFFHTDSYAVGVAVSGQRAFLADGWDGLHVFDVSNPANPTAVGSFDTAMFARDVALAGNLAFVTDSSGLTYVLDVSNPASPSLASTLSRPLAASGVAASGSRLYLAEESNGLRIFDASSPAGPVEVGSFTPGCSVNDVAVSGGNVLVLTSCDMWVLDVADPAAPATVGRLENPAATRAIAAAGAVAALASENTSVSVVALANPAAPVEATQLAAPNITLDVAFDGHYAFLANESGGLRVVDVADAAAPVEVASLTTLGRAYSIAINDHRAYVGMDGGLRVVDVTDPLHPALVGSADQTGTAWDIVVAGDLAFVANGSYGPGLLVYSVADPTHPVLAGSLPPFAGTAFRVAVAGTRALVADLNEGLHVVDVSVPAAPVQTGLIAFPSAAWSVAVSGAFAYVCDGDGTVHVLDVADPTPPAEVGSVALDESTEDLAIDGAFLYASYGDRGIAVVSLAQPARPEVVGRADTPGQTRGLVAAGGLLAVADFEQGVALFSTDTCPTTLCSLACTADATPRAGLAPLVVAFAGDLAADDCGADTPTFEWDFGDGTPHSTAQSGSHAYTTSGSRTATLTVGVGAHHATCAAAIAVAGAPPRHFDFGTPTSALAAGFTRVSQSTGAPGIAGFGWSSGVLASRDRGTGSELLRDFVFSPDAGFDLFLPAGAYDVTVMMGDAAARHDQMGLLVEGRTVDSVTTIAGQFATRTTRLALSDRALNLGIRDLGGSDPNAVINALVVTGATPLKLDFGTPASPVAEGYTQVAHTTTYSEKQGYGWLSGTIGSRDRATGTALSRDFDFTPLGTFAVDVVNGTYDVVVTMGDKTAAHDQMGVFIEGVQVDTVTTASGAVRTTRYRAVVADGQLTLTLDDLGGGDPNAVINTLEVYGGAAGAPGTLPSSDVPKAIHDLETTASTVAVTGVAGTIVDVEVTVDIHHNYDSDLSAVLIGPDGTHVALFDGVGADGDDFAQTTLDDEAATAIAGGTAPFAGWFRPAGPLAALVGKSPNGTWTLEVADNDGGVEGTLLAWSVTIVTAEIPGARRFDFGTPTSPLAAGYTRASHTTVYTPAQGYGWTSGPISSRDRVSGGDLNRDFCFTPLGTFAVDLPAGTYDVAVTTGDATAKHDQMGIEIEGASAGVVTANAGTFPVTTLRRQVTDGKLTVVLKDNGGSDANVVINALEVTPVTP